jgi:glutathione S-transferase
VSGTGLVPTLVDGEITVWESLSILEYVAEVFPEKQLWPEERAARAHARSISSELHAGFGALRSACPMNLGKRFARRDRGAEVAGDAFRIAGIWREARERFGKGAGGPFLYGRFTAADAMYAPIVTRLDTYDFEVDGEARAYMDAVLGHDAFQAWLEAALEEEWIVAEDEVDEPALVNLRPHLGN